MSQVQKTNTNTTKNDKSGYNAVIQLLLEYIRSDPNAINNVESFIGHLGDRLFSCPLKKCKRTELTAKALGYEKSTLLKKAIKAHNELNFGVANLNLEDLRMKLVSTYRANRASYLSLIANPNFNMNKQLIQVYSEWISILQNFKMQRDVDVNAASVGNLLTKLCGIAPDTQFIESRLFSRNNLGQVAIDHINRYGLFLTPQEQEEEEVDHPVVDFKVSVSENAVFLHYENMFDGTNDLRICANSGNVITLSTLQMALDQISLLSTEVDLSYVIHQPLSDILSQFFNCQPTSLLLHYTLPKSGDVAKPVELDLAWTVRSGGFQNKKGGNRWHNITIDPKKIDHLNNVNQE